MLTKQKALLGKRIYKGVSQSPNRGQVSAQGAQGYIKRELKNQQSLKTRRMMGQPAGQLKGRDGKSDMRSGVAAKSMQRANKQKIGKKQFGGPKDGRPVMGQQGGQNGGQQNSGPLGQPQGPPPQVKINNAGLLELPYSQDVASQSYDLVGTANDQLLKMKQEADQQGEQYAVGTRDANIAYDQLRRSTLNQNAAQGTAFSSKYSNSVSGNANAFANQIGDLDRQNTSFKQQQGIQRGAIETMLNQQLAALTQGYANELGAQAGTLGFGKDKMPKPKSKPKKNEPKKHDSKHQPKKRPKHHAHTPKHPYNPNPPGKKRRAASSSLKRQVRK